MKKPRNKCSTHKRYKGIREPRIGCLECWQYYTDQEAVRDGKIREDISDGVNFTGRLANR